MSSKKIQVDEIRALIKEGFVSCHGCLELDEALAAAEKRARDAEEEFVVFGFVTDEAIGRLERGGNCRGSVPVHKGESRVAKIPVYIRAARPEAFEKEKEE